MADCLFFGTAALRLNPKIKHLNSKYGLELLTPAPLSYGNVRERQRVNGFIVERIFMVWNVRLADGGFRLPHLGHWTFDFGLDPCLPSTRWLRATGHER